MELAKAHFGRGNEAFAAKRFHEAVEEFSKAIEVQPQNAMLFSNRSVAQARLLRWELALEDGKQAILLKPHW
jgi:Flp pilus assembly protein TadD